MKTKELSYFSGFLFFFSPLSLFLSLFLSASDFSSFLFLSSAHYFLVKFSVSAGNGEGFPRSFLLGCFNVSHGSVHRVLASAQIGSGVLHTGIAKTGVLLGLKSQTRQARVTCVPINIRRCWRSIRTGWRWHCRIQGGIAQVVQVIQAVEAGAGHPGDCRRYHA